ncbi:MAG: FixH family protein [Verrucomicrobiae bacterium]|nr:FixH family protein [Verrucomicrobiae bacterium]
MKTTRNLWPLGIIGAFICLIVGLTTVVAIAVTHRETLVNNNYYEQELKFQDQIDSIARTQKSGAAIHFDAASARLTITLPAAHLAQKFSGTIELYRPSESKLDREFPLEPKADGTQTLNLSQLTTGLWVARARWEAGGEKYFLEEKISLGGK